MLFSKMFCLSKEKRAKNGQVCKIQTGCHYVIIKRGNLAEEVEEEWLRILGHFVDLFNMASSFLQRNPTVGFT